MLSLGELARAVVQNYLTVAVTAPCVMPRFRRRCLGGPAASAVPCCCGVGEPCAFAAYWLFHLAGHLGYEFKDFVLGVACWDRGGFAVP